MTFDFGILQSQAVGVINIKDPQAAVLNLDAATVPVSISRVQYNIDRDYYREPAEQSEIVADLQDRINDMLESGGSIFLGPQVTNVIDPGPPPQSVIEQSTSIAGVPTPPSLTGPLEQPAIAAGPQDEIGDILAAGPEAVPPSVSVDVLEGFGSAYIAVIVAAIQNGSMTVDMLRSQGFTNDQIIAFYRAAGFPSPIGK